MASMAYELVAPIAKLAKQTAVCAPLMFGPHDDGAAMTTFDEVTIASRSHDQRMGEWASLYDLNENEMNLLKSGEEIRYIAAAKKLPTLVELHGLSIVETMTLNEAMQAWPKNMWNEGVNEEIDNILASRQMAKMPQVTSADLAEIRMAIASGLIPGVKE